MAKKGGQKFIGANRAPRVQIEYDVFVDGAQRTVDLPFVMGVMADLSGASASGLPDVADRAPVEIDAENFDKVLKAQKPTVKFNVPNSLSESGGDLPVEITFESLEDFSPAAVARKVEPLRKLLQAREQLEGLKREFDLNAKAATWFEKNMTDPAFLQAIMSARRNSDGKTPEA